MCQHSIYNRQGASQIGKVFYEHTFPSISSAVLFSYERDSDNRDDCQFPFEEDARFLIVFCVMWLFQAVAKFLFMSMTLFSHSYISAVNVNNVWQSVFRVA